MELVSSIEQGYSIGQLSELTGLDRRTVTKLLKPIKPKGPRKLGHPTYRFLDVAYVLGKYHKDKNGGYTESDGAGIGFGEGQVSPDTLMPKERKDWYEGEEKRLKVEQQTGNLVPVDMVQDLIGSALKSLSTTLLTLADSLEREIDLTPTQVEQVNETTRRMMNELADNLGADVRNS